MLDSVIDVVSGPLLPKMVLAALVAAFFLILRTKDTEGEMGGYALITALLVLRDLVSAVFANASLIDAFDILIVLGMLYLAMRPFRLGWAFWLSLAADIAGLGLILVAALGYLPGLPEAAIRLIGLLPLAAMALLPLVAGVDGDTNARQLVLRTRIFLTLGLAVYVAAGSLIGSGSPLFLLISSPFVCCLLFVVAILFVDILQKALVTAVDYYEESVDSLYDLLLSTGTGNQEAESLLENVVQNMTRSIVERTGADGGILLLADEYEETISVRALYGSYPPPFKLPENLPKDPDHVLSYLQHARFRLGEGLFGEVARTGKTVFSVSDRGAAKDSAAVSLNGEEDWLQVGSFIVSPLILRDRIIGVLSVVKTGNGIFSERDFDRCKLLANFGSIAVASSFSFLETAERSDIEHEADIAADMQRKLLPDKLPKLPALDLAVFSDSARGVCSDYYDVLQTRADKLLLAAGEAAGKGVAAGTVLVMIRAILHLITASTKDNATLMQWVNRGLAGKVNADNFATLCLASVDARQGSVEIVNAGRQAALVCRAASGDLEAIGSQSVPVGIDKGSVYSTSQVQLEAGDLLILFTDGVVETMNAQGRQYGLKSLGAAIQSARQGNAAQIVDRLQSDLEDFAGKTAARDDRTILVLKRGKP